MSMELENKKGNSVISNRKPSAAWKLVQFILLQCLVDLFVVVLFGGVIKNLNGLVGVIFEFLHSTLSLLFALFIFRRYIVDRKFAFKASIAGVVVQNVLFLIQVFVIGASNILLVSDLFQSALYLFVPMLAQIRFASTGVENGFNTPSKIKGKRVSSDWVLALTYGSEEFVARMQKQYHIPILREQVGRPRKIGT